MTAARPVHRVADPAVVDTALRFSWQGPVSPGDVTYVPTAYFLVHGYLRDLGDHISNLQGRAGDTEERLGLHAERSGIAGPFHASGGWAVGRRMLRGG